MYVVYGFNASNIAFINTFIDIRLSLYNRDL